MPWRATLTHRRHVMQTAAPSLSIDALYQTVAQYPEGIGLEQLLTALTPSPARRSLQRWLATLVRQVYCLHPPPRRDSDTNPGPATIC
jgi:hypothetical protein